MAKDNLKIDEKTLAELKKALLEKREKLTSELAAFAEKSKDIKGNFKAKFAQIGARPDENALEVSQYEVDLGLEHKLETDLADVNEALEKTEKGVYGICENCPKSRLIDIKRLRAFPEAKTCLKCSPR
ncbi:hypothetical protein KKG29_03895 [Patescibacteria group bacterium]|nr:hypothetical protein [Patescibacteria group bacterium]MBU4000287.1 hypothetical protein [Patescibacteria group bacterium]MBU4057097.1 hypothetical protein [Patescibacteria group bacterium]MBU4368475.1 hypothetical protein [Patescibacteria group bacterium]